MPLNTDFKYLNCVMSSHHSPDRTFTYPTAWVNSPEKYIIVREFYTSAMNGHLTSDAPADNILLMATFVDDMQSKKFVCISNSANSKKKRFRVINTDLSFEVGFLTIGGEIFTPAEWLFDFCLCWR